jgi:nucleoside-diphosphate-sugar epimerase
MILVTGGTGLVGSHLILELLRKHGQVRAIYRPSSNRQHVLDIFTHYLEDPQAYYNKIEWVPGDITDATSLAEALTGIGDVYHAAADVSFRPSARFSLIRNNAGGTANLVNACLEKGIRKLCFVSSTAALGNAPPGEMINEKMLWTHSKNRSLYSISKFNSEMEVWRGIAEGLNAVIVNPSIIIGPGDWKRSSSYLFSAVWKGLKFYTEGITGYVDVRDVISAMIFLMESEHQGERYTVSAENLSYRQVLEKIAENLGKKPPRYHAGPLLISAAWRLDWLRSTVSGRPRNITREAVRASRRKALFTNQKIRETTGMDFIPIDQSIRETAGIFLKALGVRS